MLIENFIIAIKESKEIFERNNVDTNKQEFRCSFNTMIELAESIENKLERWLELLKTDGINSKCMVANDIQHILEEMKK